MSQKVKKKSNRPERQKKVGVLVALSGLLAVVLFAWPGLFNRHNPRATPATTPDRAAAKPVDVRHNTSGAHHRQPLPAPVVITGDSGEDALSLPHPTRIGESWGGASPTSHGTEVDDLIFNRPMIPPEPVDLSPIEIRAVIFGEKVQLYDNGAKKYIANTKNDTNLAVGDQFEYDKQLWQIMSISQTEVRVVSQKTGSQQVIGKK